MRALAGRKPTGFAKKAILVTIFAMAFLLLPNTVVAWHVASLNSNGDINWTVDVTGSALINTSANGSLFIFDQYYDGSSSYFADVAKYNRYGDLFWHIETLYEIWNSSIVVDRLSNIFISGVGKTASYEQDFSLLASYNTYGRERWHFFHDNISIYDTAVDREGNLIVAGNRYTELGSILKEEINNLIVKKFSGEGEVLWTRVYKNNSSFSGLYVGRNDDIFLAVKTDMDEERITLIKYDKKGNLQWESEVDLFQRYRVYRRGIVGDQDDNIFLVGKCGEYDEEYYGEYYCVAKYSPEGQQLWTKKIMHPFLYPFPVNVSLNQKGQPIVCGTFDDDPYDWWSDKDWIFCCQYDSDGNLLWTTRHENSASLPTVVLDTIVDRYNNVYVSARICTDEDGYDCTDYQFVVIKLDDQGQEEWASYPDSNSASFQILKNNSDQSSGAIYAQFLGSDSSPSKRLALSPELQWDDDTGDDDEIADDDTSTSLSAGDDDDNACGCGYGCF